MRGGQASDEGRAEHKDDREGGRRAAADGVQQPPGGRGEAPRIYQGYTALRGPRCAVRKTDLRISRDALARSGIIWMD